MNTTQNKILNYLKLNAVGEENKKTGAELVLALGLKNTVELRRNIRCLRMDDGYYIASNHKGYWLKCLADEDDKGYSYLVNHAISEMKAALQIGTKPNVFYKALNQMCKELNIASHNQIDLDGSVVKRYGDDLKGE